MTKQLDNTMIRELSADELLVVSGAKPKEAQAARYEAYPGIEMNMGMIKLYVNSQCWNAWVGRSSAGGCR